MKKIHKLDAEQVKSFSENHRKQKILLTTYGKKTSARFEARLTLGEFKAVCDFITKNFKNDGSK
jgi:hypothetical protein